MEYLKISNQYPEKQESIKFLFSPEAKYVASPFLVGTQKQVFYGMPIMMISNSELIKSIPDWSKQPIEVATAFTLTETNTPGFVVVWLLMNDLFPFDFDRYTTKDLLIIWQWMNYFGYTNKDKIYQVLSKIEYKWNDDEIKLLMKNLITYLESICESDPTSNFGIWACGRILSFKIHFLDNYTSADEDYLMEAYGFKGNIAKDIGDFVEVVGEIIVIDKSLPKHKYKIRGYHGSPIDNQKLLKFIDAMISRVNKSNDTSEKVKDALSYLEYVRGLEYDGTIESPADEDE